MYNSIHSSSTDADADADADANIVVIPTSPTSSFDVDTGENNNEEEHRNSSSDTTDILLIAHRGALQRSQRWLYLSHFVAHFSENYWQFSVILFLSAISNFESIFYISTFGLSLNIGTLLVTPCLGNWIDRRLKEGDEQLRILRCLLVGKHTAVMVLALLCSLVLRATTTMPLLPQSEADDDSSSSSSSSVNVVPNKPLTVAAIVALAGTHILGTAAQVLDQTYNIIIERDLVVVLSQYYAAAGDDADNISSQSEWLSKTNATMKQIGLIAPGMISFLILEDDTYYQYTCLIVGIISAIAWAVEYLCITKIFQQILPVLQQREAASSCIIELDDLDDLAADTTSIMRVDSRNDINIIEEDIIIVTTKRDDLNRWAIMVYLEQPGAPAGISLALIYGNSVTFGNGMLTAYLLNRGMKAQTIGVFRGISSAVGLLVS